MLKNNSNVDDGVRIFIANAGLIAIKKLFDCIRNNCNECQFPSQH